MKPITLKLRKKTKFRLDMGFLSCNPNITSAEKLKSQIIFNGKNQYKVSELFFVSGFDVKNIFIKSAKDIMDNIGKNMDGMNITVHGNVGHSFGKEMKSGMLKLYGNSLEYTASGIKGGSLFVFGNTGNYLCGKPSTNNTGILDGLIYIKGNVGNHSIQRMRRGNIIIEGNIGDHSCHQMISGSIIIKGKIGKNFCDEIKRGTIIVKDKKVVKDYLLANNAEVNFVKFYLLQISKWIGKNILPLNKNIIRYHGHKDKNNICEVFLVKN
jgi:formylmethanofuran dehydrogenase subunit C